MVDPDDISDTPQVITDASPLSPEDTTLIVQLLLNIDSWFFARKRCLPKGTAIVDLKCKNSKAQLLIGIACSDWELRIGSKRHGAFFDPVTTQIRGILKRTFPQFASEHSQSMWKAGVISSLKEAAEPSGGITK